MGLGIVAGAAAGAAGTTALDAATYLDMTVRGRAASDTSAADWMADLLPHLAYGLVTYVTLQALEP